MQRFTPFYAKIVFYFLYLQFEKNMHDYGQMD
jgi:hypothetical protein